VIFSKSTMFKSKIEKKTKEEYRKEVDKWMEFLTAKGIAHEIYQPPPVIKKKVAKEEEILLHGIEKEEFCNNTHLLRKYFITGKSRVREFYNTNTRDFYYILLFSILIILLLVLLRKINYQSSLIERNNESLNELKFLIKSMNNFNAIPTSTFEKNMTCPIKTNSIFN
jgi:hypothetical protein